MSDDLNGKIAEICKFMTVDEISKLHNDLPYAILSLPERYSVNDMAVTNLRSWSVNCGTCDYNGEIWTKTPNTDMWHKFLEYPLATHKNTFICFTITPDLIVETYNYLISENLLTPSQ